MNTDQQNAVETQEDEALTQQASEQLESSETTNDAESTAEPSYEEVAAQFSSAVEAANQVEAPAAEQPQQPSQQPQAPASPDLLAAAESSNRLESLEQYVQQQQQAATQKEIDDTVGLLKGQGKLGMLSDFALRGILEHEYRSDPKFRTAWDNRNIDRKLFDSVVKAKAIEMEKTHVGDLVDSSAAKGIEAARATARAGDQTGRNPNDYSDDQIANMTTAEFDQYKRENGLL